MMDVKTARLLGQSPNFAGLEELDLGGASFPIEAWDEVLKWPWLSRKPPIARKPVGRIKNMRANTKKGTTPTQAHDTRRTDGAARGGPMAGRTSC
jgi:hypothetical protein